MRPAKAHAEGSPSDVLVDAPCQSTNHQNGSTDSAPGVELDSSASGTAHCLMNPFRDNAAERIPILVQARRLESGEINGYIKCRFPKLQQRAELLHTPVLFPSVTSSKNQLSGSRSASHSLLTSTVPFLDKAGQLNHGKVARLPPSFGRGLTLSKPDQNLFDFCKWEILIVQLIAEPPDAWNR